MRGKGEVRHFNANGTVWDDLRKGRVSQGKNGGRTYEFTIRGVSTWNYRASDGRAFHRNNKTSGRDNTPENYICTEALLTVQDGDISREYQRLPGNPAPAL